MGSLVILSRRCISETEKNSSTAMTTEVYRDAYNARSGQVASDRLCKQRTGLVVGKLGRLGMTCSKSADQLAASMVEGKVNEIFCRKRVTVNFCYPTGNYLPLSEAVSFGAVCATRSAPEREQSPVLMKALAGVEVRQEHLTGVWLWKSFEGVAVVHWGVPLQR